MDHQSEDEGLLQDRVGQDFFLYRHFDFDST